MATLMHRNHKVDAPTPASTTTATTPAHPSGPEAQTGPRIPWMTLLRTVTGFIFLWAFLDKTFGLGYATPSNRAWIHGGSPTKGFLASVAVGPFRTPFHNIAGQGWADWLFMLGLLTIGVAVIAGVALRLAAVGGGLLMLLMWAAEWPLAKHTVAGAPSGSNNPLVDYHVIYAAMLVTIAFLAERHRSMLGAAWQRLPFVQRHRSILA
jgi:thiosulfate dehydrogenase [quinone] large subunit